MRPMFDGKSLLLGGFAGAALVAGLGAMQVVTTAGRYQMEAEATITAGGNREYKVFVLDTATGDVWQAKPGERPDRRDGNGPAQRDTSRAR